MSLSIHMPVYASPVSSVRDLAPSDQLKPCCSDSCTSGGGIVNQTLAYPMSSHLREQLIGLVYSEIRGIAFHSGFLCASLAHYNNLCGNEMFSNGTADKYCN